MSLAERLDPFRLYSPAEAAALLGPHVSISWIKARARADARLVTRHTGRRTMLFTAGQICQLRGLTTADVGPMRMSAISGGGHLGPAGATASPVRAEPASPASTANAPGESSRSLRPVLRSLNAGR